MLRVSTRHRPNTRRYSTPMSLPFRITRAEANNIMISKRSFLDPSPKKTQDITVIKCDPVKECYVPIHGAGFKNIKTQFVCEYGKYRTVYDTIYVYNSSTKTSTPVIVPRTVTDWYDANGKLKTIAYPITSKWTQVYAGHYYPRKIIENTLTTNKILELQPLTKEMIHHEKTRIVYPHQMNMAFALEKLNARLRDMETARVITYVKQKYHADEVKITNMEIAMEKAEINLQSWYMPAFIYETTEYDYPKYHIVNGYTGDAETNHIYSVVKSAIMGVGFGSVLGLGFSVMTRPYLLPLEVAARILIASSASGLLGGIMAKYRNESNTSNDKQQVHDDINLNSKFIETEEDIARKKFAEEINEKFEYIIKNRQRFPIDKLKLFGLDTAEIIGKEELKLSYQREIKRWHPDTHPNKEVAENMTKQIIIAHKELKEILEKIDQ